MRRLVLTVLGALALYIAMPALAQNPATPPPPTDPPRAQGGSALVNAVAIGTIVVAGAAGIFVYRAIRKGL